MDADGPRVANPGGRAGGLGEGGVHLPASLPPGQGPDSTRTDRAAGVTAFRTYCMQSCAGCAPFVNCVPWRPTTPRRSWPGCSG